MRGLQLTPRARDEQHEHQGQDNTRESEAPAFAISHWHEPLLLPLLRLLFFAEEESSFSPEGNVLRCSSKYHNFPWLLVDQLP